MMLLSLLTCVLLGALSAQAEVVQSFHNCKEFFYNGEEPTGMDQNAKKICQKLQNNYFFATLYSTNDRIPVYSAYIFNSAKPCSGRGSSTWFIEPQISTDNMENMSSEKKYSPNVIKIKQAIVDDYKSTGYDRGHLNPNCFQEGNGRTATFTLTNAAPMDHTFNCKLWRNCEMTLKNILVPKLDKEPKPVYLVTGTVPNGNVRIPQREQNESPRNDQEETHEYERVTVPTYVWTAVCYPHQKPFSFAYIGENKENGAIEVMSVTQLNNKLRSIYGSSVTIFAEDCFSMTKESQDMEKLMKESLKKFSDTIIQSADSECADLENSRDEEMTAADGTQCFSEERFCKTQEGYKRRCTSPCLYEEQLKDYRCYSGQSYIQCSPKYSFITAKGEKCKDDHPCGTYGLDYYWCAKASGSWDYCSPPLPDSITVTGKRCRTNHACAKYGKRYHWCYNDNDNWEKCCTHNDRFSAVKGKTCQPDHPCGYHGATYLWCYTTDGGWKECCVGE